MGTEFLHGIETVDIQTPGAVARIVKSSIIGLIGIAPKGPAQKLTLSLNPVQDAAFGQPIPGFNIPKTLDIIRQVGGNCPVLIVNVFNEANHTEDVNETKQFVNDKIVLNGYPVNGVIIKLNDVVVDAVEGIDYLIDFDKINILSHKLSNGVAYKIEYKILDTALIEIADLLGGVTGGNQRTGIELFDLAYNSFGYTPKILISPEFSHKKTFGAALRNTAKKSRGIALIDGAPRSSMQDIIESRGATGAFSFDNADRRALLLYPQLKSYDKALDVVFEYPYSAYMAGIIAKNDNENGYWTSPSNQPLSIVEGAEAELYASLNDANCDVNVLNAAGVLTVFNAFGTGFLTWGNRNASFPTSNDPKSFINIQRTADIVAESVELAAFKYSDRNINKAFIDLVREEGNTLFRVLVGRGVFLPGSKVVYNPDDNPSAQLANGQVVFEYRFMVPAPAEHIIFKSTIDINLYKNLK